MFKRRCLDQSLHPFDDQPFEVFYRGSWRSVERIRISDGTLSLNISEFGYLYEQKEFLSTLRLRPRRATSTDCICLLRPAIDVCVLSTSDHSSENSSEETTAIQDWFDARITSVERCPHESRCDCKFYVKFYYVSDNGGTDRRKLSKEVHSVSLDQISVLQVLELTPSENTHYRWNFAENCTSVMRNKLFLGKFATDISWMVVTSVKKQTVFDVRSIGKKLVYQILDGSFGAYSTSVHLSGINFKSKDGVVFSMTIPFVPYEDGNTIPALPQAEEEEDPQMSYDLMDLRRSKRRNKRPQRYMGDIGLEAADLTALRFGWKRQGKGNELALVLADDDDLDGFLEDHHSEEDLDHTVELYKGETFGSNESGDEEREKLIKRKNASKEKKKSGQEEKEAKVKNSKKDKEGKSELAIVPVQDEGGEVPQERSHLLAEIRPNPLSTNDDNMPLKYYRKRYKAQGVIRTKRTSDLDDYYYDSRTSAGRAARNRLQRTSYFSASTSRRNSEDSSNRRTKKTLDLMVYKDLIATYMKNIQMTIDSKQPVSTDAWKNLQGTQAMYDKKAAEEALPAEEEEESETEMLFREMELCLAAAYYLDEENKKADGGEDPIEKFLKSDNKSCRHVFIVDDEIGILCKLCGYVITEIRDVSPPFMQQAGGGFTKYDRSDKGEKDDTEHKLLDEACADLIYNPPSSNDVVPESNENVWGLIPNIRKKLHDHQKKAFEFLWRNLAGSMIPSEMEPSSKKVGGCVISHSPGAGKTFLIIAFLVSYLKVFPGKRPLVLAPKTTLYTWYKEIIKWEFPVPVYQIHGRKTYRDRIYMQKVGNSSSNVVPNGDIMHVLDCLEKIQKWHAHPSVLLMGYTSFLSLMRDDAKYAHRRYMGQILRESPGILVLDEGHNPRSTKSRLRKALMRVNTDFRILLSGTLFQNNFGEYFNTLCLARPRFVNEVLRVLDPKYKKKIKGQMKTRTSIENRARKVFMDIIAKKIDSNEPEERVDGLNMLKNLTKKFIDVYEGSGSSENLPGLQSYTLMMKSTPLQHEILVRLHQHMNVARGFPLELELMITLGSIHPSLIHTAVCANKFLSLEELHSLDEFRLDPTKGSKVKFVLGLVQRSIIRREKVLIFCHNIAPINLFIELFQRIFGWRKGHDVLVLQGDLELFERGRVMDKFEERGSPAKVLLASINACAEGITLTAASRVVLLDSEWNPSKQKQAIARAFRPGQEKVVYVYQLLATGTLEEDKYGRTTWKEWVSCMIFSEELVDDPSKWQAEKIEDALLREIVEEDHAKSFHMIMKNERASYENPLKSINEE